MGSGIPRALKEWPRIDLIDDVAGNQFSAVIWRPQNTDQVTDQVTDEIARLLSIVNGEMTRAEIQQTLGLRHLPHLRDTYLNPAIKGGWIEMTLPDKPQSRLQKYRLTSNGRAYLATRKSKLNGQT